MSVGQVEMFEGTKVKVPWTKAVPDVDTGPFHVQKFVENFEVVAEAEGGITRLRELAIELAVRGLLLEGADASRWARVQLSDVVADFQNGISKRHGDSGRPVPVLRLADIVAGKLLRQDELREIPLTPQEEHKYRVELGDVLVIRVNGSADLVGRFVPCEIRRTWAYSDHLIRLRLRLDKVDTAFLCAASRSAASRSHLATKTVTTAGQRTINQGGLSSLPLLLPPLTEQKRIVAKVDELMSLLDDLEAKQNAKRDAQAKLRSAALGALASADGPEDFATAWKRVTENFKHLFDDKSSVDHLRSMTLELAMSGRLGARVEADGTGAEVLRSVHALPHGYDRRRKLFKEKSEVKSSPVTQKLPSHWAAGTVQELYEQHIIVDYADGNHGSLYPRAAEFGNVGVPFVTAKNIAHGRVDVEGSPRLSEDKAASLTKGWAQGGDVLLTHNATVGRVGIVAEGEGRFLLGTSATYFRLNPSGLDSRFFAYYLMSPAWQNQLSAIMQQTTRNQVSIQKQASFIVRVPPMAEQRRISALLDSLMKFCDDLEARLKTADETASKLVQALVAELVEA